MKQTDIYVKLQKFNRDANVMKLDRIFKRSSILEVMGIERRETRHSRFLKWLFDDADMNTLDNHSPIFHLFDILVRRDSEQRSLLGDTFKNNIIQRNLKLRVEDVQKEYPTKGVTLDGKTGAIDLYIKVYDEKSHKTIHLTIENKVESNEHDYQTWKYYAFMTGEDVKLPDDHKLDFEKGFNPKRYADDEKIFVFLTPSAEFDMKRKDFLRDKCLCDKYIHINYQDLVDEVLTPLIEDETTPTPAKEKIKQYVATLGIPGKEKTNSKEEKDTKSKSVMATGKIVKGLAYDIFNDYQDVIKEVVFNKEYIQFKNSYRDFLTNLLTTISHSSLDENNFWLCKLMVLRLNGKNKNYMVLHGEAYHIYSQTEFALNFAKLYCKECTKNNLDFTSLNNDFNDVKSSTASTKLFSDSQTYDTNKKCFLNDEVFDYGSGRKIYFANNIWGTGDYLKKLENFISKKYSEKYKVIYSPRE